MASRKSPVVLTSPCADRTLTAAASRPRTSPPPSGGRSGTAQAGSPGTGGGRRAGARAAVRTGLLSAPHHRLTLAETTQAEVRGHTQEASNGGVRLQANVV